MAERAGDHFSSVSHAYSAFRPRYPSELFDYVESIVDRHQLAWDCGCGNGQATVAIAAHFSRVVGTDPSATQIDAAEARPNIDYRVEPAEHSSLAGASASLVTVAQALHWFDHAAFYTEVKRVLQPKGLFAAWAYSDCSTGEAAIDRIKDRLYIDLTGPYWPPERVHVDAGYKTPPFPFVEIAAPSFAMEAQWTVDHLLAYFRSWSATQRYLRANGQDPIALIEPDLRAAWGEANPRRTVRWQFHLRCGKAA